MSGEVTGPSPDLPGSAVVSTEPQVTPTEPSATVATSGTPAWAIGPSPAGANPHTQPEVTQATADVFNSDRWVAKLHDMGVVFVSGDDATAVLGGWPQPGSCDIVKLDVSETTWVGSYQPDDKCTPGAIHVGRLANALANRTYCAATGVLRPDLSRLKLAMFLAQSTVPVDPNVWEADHFAPLELCGATHTENLWDQPPSSVGQTSSHNHKDNIENALAKRVRAGHMSVSEALWRILGGKGVWTHALDP